MEHRTRAVLALGVTVAATGACGEKEVATSHIQSVLGATASAESAARGDSTTTAEGEGQPDTSPVLSLPNGDTLHIRPAVVAFYEGREYQPAWTDDDEILPRGSDMLEAIGLANTEGLDRERYHYSTAREMAELLAEDAVEDRELEYLGSLDLLLSESFARLSEDLVGGTIDPSRAGLTWRIDRGSADDRALIERAAEGENPRQVLGTVRPHVPYYDRLVKALGRLRNVAEEGGWPTVPDGETVEPGDSSPRVAALRARLLAGDDADETRLARHGQDRIHTFDDSLAQALVHFQKRHNLQEDGALGPATLAALNVPVEDRIDAVRLNLDRWRWLPAELGDRFILVNIAGFELEVVDADSVLESMNVVVGQTANRTPVFHDTLEYMVVNPYWNVPQSIAEEEILPKAQRDPTFLARNNYEVVAGDDPIGSSIVDPDAIRSGAHRIRQKPGGANALGNVKFLFPNNYDIYLHDTPADHLFTQKTRAFSHGCIRVERPDDLARTLLTALTDRGPEDYDSLRQSTGEQWVPFDQKIPVYILYFTAWVDQDGTIRFHPDIYDRDRTLEGEQQRELAPVQPRPIQSTRS